MYVDGNVRSNKKSMISKALAHLKECRVASGFGTSKKCFLKTYFTNEDEIFPQNGQVLIDNISYKSPTV